MARRRDIPCCKCGELGWGGKGVLPVGQYTCQDCRRKGLARESTCVCGANFIKRTSRAKLCDDCIAKARVPKIHTCPCGATFPRPYKGSKRKHCDDCTVKAAWIPVRQKPGPTGLNARKRARKYGVAYEPINKQRVFVRDGWRCGICREPVDKRLKFPHPRSASLDHVLPMSRGGDHVYANVQCSHLECNSRKSNRGYGEQLALVG